MVQSFKGAVLIRVARGTGDRWDVIEQNFAMPIASFSDCQEARDYASSLASTKGGTAVVVLEEESEVPILQTMQDKGTTNTSGIRN